MLTLPRAFQSLCSCRTISLAFDFAGPANASETGPQHFASAALSVPPPGKGDLRIVVLYINHMASRFTLQLMLSCHETFFVAWT